MKPFLRPNLFLIFFLALSVSLWLLWRESSDREKNYSLIEEGLYVGGVVAEPPPGTQAVLNLCGKEEHYSDIVYCWEPILEGGAEPDLAWLKRMVGFVEVQRRAGATIYVHCLAGMNRSATVATAYLMFAHQWTRDEALSFARSKRPVIDPNPAMMRLLAEWEQDLNRKK